MKTNDDVTITRLPDNDFVYVVVNFGVAAKQKLKSEVPNIQVILRKVDLINNKYVVKKEDDILAYIALHELDAVRIGTLWKRKKRVKDVYWQDYGNLNYSTDTRFSFNFQQYNPTTITYEQNITELNDSSLANIYINNLPESNSTDINKIKLLRKTKYTKLIDSNHKTILIPCMELFVSTYTPESKTIKEMLLKFDVDTALDKYLKPSECLIDGGDYVLSLNESSKGLFGDRNLRFIAYMKLNSISRQRVSKLWSSLEFDEGDIIDKAPVRYPEVLPYHPNTLLIESDGLWLNENVFLVLRINNRSLPKDFDVSVKYDNISVNILEDHLKESGRENEDINNDEEEISPDAETVDVSNPLTPEEVPGINSEDLNLDSNEEPTKRVFKQRVYSEVGVIGEEPKTSHIVNNKHYEITKGTLDERKGKKKAKPSFEFDKTGDNSSEINDEPSDNVPQDLSSAEDSSNDTKDVKKFYVEEKNFSPETQALFESVIEALERLQKKYKDFNYYFVDKEFEDKTSFTESKTSFYETLVPKKNDSWYRLKVRDKEKGGHKNHGFRAYLLIHIIVKGKHYYLLEIGKKDGESYSGLVFQSGNDMKVSIVILKELLQAVVQNKGAYSKADPKSTDKKVLKPVKLGVEYVTYKHTIKEKKYIRLYGKIKNKLNLD
ncbi:hypothetical protein [Candidatus Marinarcus aquaticus]|uniref:Uncharacterized protein n=1 Tax=Candidatus Marinarcus aquaticus TaxID=2044504 RepID=A0A4Q0XMP1_9BACT|nr:hypothetical protein [Candidatus Marinarcus aquaticus]RXJ54558.1 hypothetical protein CRV04_11010 [Candidatus Marinarcus aquaticus]